MASWLPSLLLACALIHTLHGYTCSNKTCTVDCASNASVCSNGYIDAGYLAETLHVICAADSICANLTINCPHTSAPSNCTLQCDGNRACDNIEFYTFSSNSSIRCGNATTQNRTAPICSNLLISSFAQDVELGDTTSSSSSPDTYEQSTTLHCTANTDTVSSHAACTNITIARIGNDIPSTAKQHTMLILCDAKGTSTNTDTSSACAHLLIANNSLSRTADTRFNITNRHRLHHLRIDDTNASALHMDNAGDMSDVQVTARNSIDAVFVINSDPGLAQRLDVSCPHSLYNRGILTASNLAQWTNLSIASPGQLNASNLSCYNLDSTLSVAALGVVHDCRFLLDHDATPTTPTLLITNSGLMLNNSLWLHGQVEVIGDGQFELNTLLLTGDADAQASMRLQLNASSSWVNNTIVARDTRLLDIRTSSLFSGVIVANESCGNLSVVCSNPSDVEHTCQNLTIWAAPHNETHLRCQGYGCQYLTLYALGGLGEVVFSASDCPCSVDCIDNCMAQWDVHCANGSGADFDAMSVFSGDVCEPAACCGNIVIESEPYFVCAANLFSNVICKHSVGLDIALIASLGVFVCVCVCGTWRV